MWWSSVRLYTTSSIGLQPACRLDSSSDSNPALNTDRSVVVRGRLTVRAGSATSKADIGRAAKRRPFADIVEASGASSYRKELLGPFGLSDESGLGLARYHRPSFASIRGRY